MDASVAGETNAEGLSSFGLWQSEVWAVLAALCSGASYGVKIRFPHALVMTFMFRRDLSTREKLKVVMNAVVEHARSLGYFAFVYKATLGLLKFWQLKYGRALRNFIQSNAMAKFLGQSIIKMIIPPVPSSGRRTGVDSSPEYGIPRIPAGQPAHPVHALIAGAVGGYFVWGHWSTLSHQVLMYVVIRVLAGLWKLLPVHEDEHWQTTHRLAATMTWALAMYLWETTPQVLQSSMRKSMDEIYDSGLFGVHRKSKNANNAARKATQKRS